MLFNHKFNEMSIPQASEDMVIRSHTIPKGYVNASALCKANKKKLNDWMRLKRTGEYLKSLSKQLNIPIFSDNRNEAGFPASFLIQEIDGYGDEQGTWVHIRVAISLAAWISPEFEVWASDVLMRVLNDEYEPLTEEAKRAKEELKKLWAEIRSAGKVARRSLTDAIKDWYERNQNGTSRPQHVMYAVTTNAIYQKLWNVDAINLEKMLGCGRNESRDFLDSSSLKLLERAESNVCDFIDEDNIKPIDAVALANIRKAKNAPKVKSR